MYWIMDCAEILSPNGEALTEVHNTFQIPGVRAWKLGRRFTVDIPQPIHVDVQFFHGYVGPPAELRDLGIPLMSDRVARALIAAGVTTFDFYQAILQNRTTGQTYPYFAYNVTMLLAAADMSQSEWECYDNNLMFDVSFYRLVLDESRCHDELAFRLGQNVNAIVVHDRVREALLARGIDTLSFIDPADWVQL
jgi:hypothetical protein